MVSHSVILAIGVIELIVQAAAAVLSILIATKGRAKAAYFLAGGMIFFAIHNLVELLTDIELLVGLAEAGELFAITTKLIASIFFLYGIWILYKSVLKVSDS